MEDDVPALLSDESSSSDESTLPDAPSPRETYRGGGTDMDVEPGYRALVLEGAMRIGAARLEPAVILWVANRNIAKDRVSQCLATSYHIIDEAEKLGQDDHPGLYGRLLLTEGDVACLSRAPFLVESKDPKAPAIVRDAAILFPSFYKDTKMDLKVEFAVYRDGILGGSNLKTNWIKDEKDANGTFSLPRVLCRFVRTQQSRSVIDAIYQAVINPSDDVDKKEVYYEPALTTEEKVELANKFEEIRVAYGELDSITPFDRSGNEEPYWFVWQLDIQVEPFSIRQRTTWEKLAYWAFVKLGATTEAVYESLASVFDSRIAADERDIVNKLTPNDVALAIMHIAADIRGPISPAEWDKVQRFDFGRGVGQPRPTKPYDRGMLRHSIACREDADVKSLLESMIVQPTDGPGWSVHDVFRKFEDDIGAGVHPETGLPIDPNDADSTSE